MYCRHPTSGVEGDGGGCGIIMGIVGPSVGGEIERIGEGIRSGGIRAIRPGVRGVASPTSGMKRGGSEGGREEGRERP